MKNQFIIYTDGGARGNPGPAGIGVIIYNNKGEIALKKSAYIGSKTNNQAEYRALILGLEEALDLKAKNAIFHLDSELVVRQMRGEYKVKNKNISQLYGEAVYLAKKYEFIKFIHVKRDKNKEADFLVNEAVDKALEK